LEPSKVVGKILLLVVGGRTGLFWRIKVNSCFGLGLLLGVLLSFCDLGRSFFSNIGQFGLLRLPFIILNCLGKVVLGLGTFFENVLLLSS
jgi:hypothetical protein